MKTVKKKFDNSIRLTKNVLTPDLPAFLRYVLNTEAQVEHAEAIIKNAPYPASEWQSIIEKNTLERGLYSKVLRILRNLGLIEKVNGEIRLSKLFFYNMQKLTDYWDDYIESRKVRREGF